MSDSLALDQCEMVASAASVSFGRIGAMCNSGKHEFASHPIRLMPPIAAVLQ